MPGANLERSVRNSRILPTGFPYESRAKLWHFPDRRGELFHLHNMKWGISFLLSPPAVVPSLHLNNLVLL